MRHIPVIATFGFMLVGAVMLAAVLGVAQVEPVTTMLALVAYVFGAVPGVTLAFTMVSKSQSPWSGGAHRGPRTRRHGVTAVDVRPPDARARSGERLGYFMAAVGLLLVAVAAMVDATPSMGLLRGVLMLSGAGTCVIALAAGVVFTLDRRRAWWRSAAPRNSPRVESADRASEGADTLDE